VCDLTHTIGIVCHGPKVTETNVPNLVLCHA